MLPLLLLFAAADRIVVLAAAAVVVFVWRGMQQFHKQHADN